MTREHLSDEALSIGTMAYHVRSSILTAAQKADRHSIDILGLAVILAAIPKITEQDLERIERVMRLFHNDNTEAGLRFAELIRSLSIWVDAVEPAPAHPAV